MPALLPPMPRYLRPLPVLLSLHAQTGPRVCLWRSVVHIIAYSNIKWTLRFKIIRTRAHNNLRIKLLGPAKCNKSTGSYKAFTCLLIKNFETLMVRALEGRRDESILKSYIITSIYDLSGLGEARPLKPLW